MITQHVDHTAPQCAPTSIGGDAGVGNTDPHVDFGEHSLIGSEEDDPQDPRFLLRRNAVPSGGASSSYLEAVQETATGKATPKHLFSFTYKVDFDFTPPDDDYGRMQVGSGLRFYPSARRLRQDAGRIHPQYLHPASVVLSGMSKTFEHFPLPSMTIAKIAKLEFLFKQKCSKVFDATRHRRKNQNGHHGGRGNAQKFSIYPIVLEHYDSCPLTVRESHNTWPT